ncbi:hypothetical protein FGD67_21115 [Colwellia sp. M166]|uniref:hypothetical protein n=1 Tax=Colwellia sp. M166 TaxID=2583805 RepID=UPI00211DDF3F|nr:hypothetical protein [Colwellia sp. M166]UUO25436.1 hypothetical protein FGD67_21115 [Colwellia sp. M166]
MDSMLLYFYIGEKMSLKNDELVLNIKRQAKRFSKIQSISLGQAQELLSIIVYDCDGWGHLLTSLKSKKFDNEFLVLSALHPKADIFLFKLLNKNIASIIARFNARFPNFEGNEEIIINLFGIELHDFERKIK